MTIERKIKITKQGTGSTINIPKVVMELMELNNGDIVNLKYNVEEKVITIRSEHATQQEKMV